jgi:hypothetical protein
MPIKVLKKYENKTIPVSHSKDHPDVKTTEKIIKKDREKAKEDFPILSKVFGTGNPKKDTEKAKRVADTLQTMASKMRTKTEGSFKKGGLSAGQKKIAAKAPPPDKIDAKDFAVLKKEKAKGRGMGLQDESIKPGKVMKAKTGKQIVKEFSASLKGIDESFKSKVHPMKKQRLLDRSTVMTKAKYGKIMKAKRGKFLRSDPTKPISSVQPSTTLPKDFVGKRKALGGVRASLGMLKGPAKAGAILGAALTVPVGKMLKKIQDKRKAKNRDEAKVKKMGGGLMNKPMGYSSGTKLMDFIKSGSYTDKYGTKTNVDKAIKKINLSPKDKDLATMKPASDKKMMGGGMMQGKIYKASEGIMLSAYKRPTMSIQEGAAKARERNKKQDERKKEIDKAAKKYRVGGGGANRYGPHKVDVNRQATEALLGRGPIQEKIIKFADKFNKRIKTKKMVGGMAKKYSVGGGMMQRPMGGPMGGMMQRPMGYKHGTKPGAGPLGAAGLGQPAKENIDQIIKDQKFPPISIYIEDKKKPQKPFPVPSLYNNNKKADKRIREGEPRAKKKPSNIFGYKSGTMVKARGCKLGRTRPTKMY